MSDIDPLSELLRRAPVGAKLDSTRRNRYSLTREIADDSGICHAVRPILFCGYNPSTADETIDDRTLRREIAFAKDLGGTYLFKVNLLSQRATKPEEIVFSEAERNFDENVNFVAELATLTLQAEERYAACGAFQRAQKRSGVGGESGKRAHRQERVRPTLANIWPYQRKLPPASSLSSQVRVEGSYRLPDFESGGNIEI